MPWLSACKLLCSPYLNESHWQPDPPLGSILLWQLSTDGSTLQALLDARAAAPWCSLVIKLPVGGPVLDPDGLHDTLSAQPGVPVFLKPGMSSVSAIRNRRPPTDAEVVRYVECRPGYERLALQLRLLVAAQHAELSSRAVRRHFSQFNHSGSRHWKWVIQLAQIRNADHESAEELAARYDLEVRALRRRVRTCLDVSLDEFRHRVGWEWRVEAALRLRGGGAMVDRPLILFHCPRILEQTV